jgi:hypothetical protein
VKRAILPGFGLSLFQALEITYEKENPLESSLSPFQTP